LTAVLETIFAASGGVIDSGLRSGLSRFGDEQRESKLLEKGFRIAARTEISAAGNPRNERGLSSTGSAFTAPPRR